MKTLIKPNKYCIRVLGKQTREDGIQYRLSRFVISEGDLMYNALTGEVLEDADEDSQIAQWFRVPENMDETALAYSIRQKWLQNANGPGGNVKNRYILFLTTVCNAHCGYCYENGTRSMTMTEQTAADVADYILSHCDRNGDVRIRWFGGEPLVNIRAIDIISGRLNAEDLKYSSEMFSNGDLLHMVTDEQIRAWNLREVQFTIDDVGAEYDRIKGLPSGAFDRICNSIDRMAALGIRVHIRIHYHPGKGPEAPLRVAKQFCGMRGVSPYCVMLYADAGEEDYDGLLAVQKYIHSHGGQRIGLPDMRFRMSCMADNRKVACITTDGHLSPCEHYPYGENYGSIYEKGYDQEVLKRWAAKNRNYCDGCVLYPSCGKQHLCPVEGKCSEASIQYQVNRIRFVLREAT